jgi:hypothetical protein
MSPRKTSASSSASGRPFDEEAVRLASLAKDSAHVFEKVPVQTPLHSLQKRVRAHLASIIILRSNPGGEVPGEATEERAIQSMFSAWRKTDVGQPSMQEYEQWLASLAANTGLTWSGRTTRRLLIDAYRLGTGLPEGENSVQKIRTGKVSENVNALYKGYKILYESQKVNRAFRGVFAFPPNWEAAAEGERKNVLWNVPRIVQKIVQRMVRSEQVVSTDEVRDALSKLGTRINAIVTPAIDAASRQPDSAAAESILHHAACTVAWMTLLNTDDPNNLEVQKRIYDDPRHMPHPAPPPAGAPAEVPTAPAERVGAGVSSKPKSPYGSMKFQEGTTARVDALLSGRAGNPGTLMGSLLRHTFGKSGTGQAPKPQIEQPKPPEKAEEKPGEKKGEEKKGEKK